MKCYIEYKIIFNSHLKIGVLLATLINARRRKNNINSGIFSKNILELSYHIPPISFNSAILLGGSDEVSICGYLSIISLVFSLRTHVQPCLTIIISTSEDSFILSCIPS